MTLTCEAATLGALLWNPAAVPGVRDWLAVSDFADPWHAEVYRTLRSHPTGPAPGFPVGVGVTLRDRVGAQHADLPRLAALAGTTPPRPDPVAYARLVLDASLTRQLASYGLVLRAGAVAAGAQHHSEPLTEALQHVRAWGAQASQRWQAAHCGGPVPLNPDVAATARTHVLLGADRFLATHPTPTTDEVTRAEELLVGALLGDPRQLTTVAALGAGDLSDPVADAALQAIRSLARAGEHADAVTVTAHLTLTTPDRATDLAARLGEWAHTGSVRDLHHLAGTVLIHTAERAALDADRSLRTPNPAHLPERFAQVGAAVDRLQALADALGRTLAPARSRLHLAPPAPRAAAEGTLVLEVG